MFVWKVAFTLKALLVAFFIVHVTYFYSHADLEADQWVEAVMSSIVEVITFVVLYFPWLKDALIHHFQGTV